MNTRGPSLRSILALTTIVVVSLALLVAGSLIALTTNLVSNAIKYSPPGSAIEVAVECTGEAVVFRVTHVVSSGSALPQRDEPLASAPRPC